MSIFNHIYSLFHTDLNNNNNFNINPLITDEESDEIFPFFHFPNNNENPLFDKEKEESTFSKEFEKNLYFKTKKEAIPKFKIKKKGKSTQLITNKRKRGKTKKSNNNKTHYPDAPDNLLRKINVHYLNFLVSFINEVLHAYNYKYKFLKLNYNFKKNVNKNIVEKMKKETIGDIIRQKISSRYKKHFDLNYNENILKEIKKKEELNKIFSDNYLNIFTKIYLKSNKIINLKEYGIDKVISLPDKVKMYKDLLLKTGEKELKKRYIKNINQCIKQNFAQNIIFLME